MEIEFKIVIRLLVTVFVMYRTYKFFITEKMGGLWDRLIPVKEKEVIKEPVKVAEKETEGSIVGKSRTVYLDEPVVPSNKPTMAINMKPAEAPKTDRETEPDDGDTVYGRRDEALDEDDRFTPFEDNATDQEFSSGKTFEELSNVVNVLKGKETSEEKRLDAADTLHGISNTAFFKFVSTQIANTETIQKLFDDFPESDGYLPKRRKSKIERFDMNNYV